jgi:uncharacterized membrane protein YkoI
VVANPAILSFNQPGLQQPDQEPNMQYRTRIAPTNTGRAKRAGTATLRTGSLMGVALLVLSASAQASPDDHDQARAALEAGEIRPIGEILTKAGAEVPGDVVEIELERERGRWVYELKIIATDGRLLEVEMDASDASLIEVEQKHRRD